MRHFPTTLVLASSPRRRRTSSDVTHVVFGCDISLPDEALVKISSIFGTTEGLAVFKGYRLAESKEIYKKIGFLDIVAATLITFVQGPKTIWRCLHMRQLWKWDTYDEYLEIPLSDIRQTFGIRVVHA